MGKEMNQQDKDRASFEAWARKNDYLIHRSPNDEGRYERGFTQDVWESWQAAKEHERGQAKKQLFATKRVIESLEARLTLATRELDDLKKNTNPELLASERKANAILTDELERQQRGEPVGYFYQWELDRSLKTYPNGFPGAVAVYSHPHTDEPVKEPEIRRLLCSVYAGPLAYMDDGEAQDNRTMPCIDFLRDDATTIQRKMLERKLPSDTK